MMFFIVHAKPLEFHAELEEQDSQTSPYDVCCDIKNTEVPGGNEELMNLIAHAVG